MLQHVQEAINHQLVTALMPRSIGSIGLAVAVGVGYFLSARLSLFLLTVPDGVAVFWPAAGVASGVLIALGPGARWPVAIGTMVATIWANLLGDRNLGIAAVSGLCNAGEALLIAWLIERYFGPNFVLDRPSQVLGMIAATAAGTAVSGIGGAAGFVYFHSSATPVLTIWQHWFASDALGVVAVAPVLIGLASALRNPPTVRESIDGTLALAVLSVVAWLAVFILQEPWVVVISGAVLFPLLLWLAARCRPVFGAMAAFIVALTTVSTTTFDLGHFFDADLPIGDRILASQISILGTSLLAFVLSALFAERRQNEAALKEGQARLQEALTAGGVMAFEWDARTGSSKRSENAVQILGLEPTQYPNGGHFHTFAETQFYSRIHPDDRARCEACVYGVRPDKPSYTIAFRFVRSDGREVWLEEASRAEFDASGRYLRLKGLIRDITRRKRNEEHQQRLVAELDHRVKNVLARVAVVAMSTRQGSNSMDEFVKALDRRIRSMADAHELLSGSRWQGANLADLVRRQLAPYTSNTNTTIAGPDITLTAATTQALAMVLQELVTNALKHGALSNPDGRLSVNWNQRPSGDTAACLAIEWRETGGPPTLTPAQSGYGTSLIRELIPLELGGTVDLVFAPEGVSCSIEIPEQAG
jgi:two-component sensor histidine kinase/integral membrane sensor domain MASE1